MPSSHRRVGPQAALAAVPAGGAGGAGMLAEVVVAGDRLSAQVAHATATAARHPVAAARLDQPRAALGALPDPRRRHALLAAAQETDLLLLLTRKFIKRGSNLTERRRHLTRVRLR